jgi:hypothetical protein
MSLVFLVLVTLLRLVDMSSCLVLSQNARLLYDVAQTSNISAQPPGIFHMRFTGLF